MKSLQLFSIFTAAVLVASAHFVHADAKTDQENITDWTGTCLDESQLQSIINAEYGIRQDQIIGNEKSLSATMIGNWLNGQSLVSVRRIPSTRAWGRKQMPSQCVYFFSRIGHEPETNLDQKNLIEARDKIYQDLQKKKIDVIKSEIYQCRDQYNWVHNSKTMNQFLSKNLEQNYRLAAVITSEEDDTQCLYIFALKFEKKVPATF